VNIRIRILDVAELSANRWYFDMHRGNYKPDYPMAGVIEYEDAYGAWQPLEVFDPPMSKAELTHIVKGTP